MSAHALQFGDELRCPQIDILLRPDALPAYVALVELRGEHDLGTSEAIRVALAPLFGDVLVDLSDCDFVDSSVIAALVAKARALDGEGFRLELVVPPTQTAINRMLEVVVEIGRLITVHVAMPEGASAFRARLRGR